MSINFEYKEFFLIFSNKLAANGSKSKLFKCNNDSLQALLTKKKLSKIQAIQRFSFSRFCVLSSYAAHKEEKKSLKRFFGSVSKLVKQLIVMRIFWTHYALIIVLIFSNLADAKGGGRGE